MSQDIIVHYGTKGMRWGVRKDRSGGTSGGGKEEAFLKTVGKTSGKGSIKTISNEVLQSRVKRLQLEKNYVELVSKEKERNRTVIEKGARGVGKLLENTGKELLKYVVQKNVVKVLETANIVPKKKD